MARRKKLSVSVPPAAGAPDTLAAPCAVSAPEVDSGLFWESNVATSFGVALARVRAVRRELLSENEHWILRRGSVVYTERGMAVLAEILRGGLSSPSPEEKVAPAQALPVLAGPPARKVFVIRRRPGNSRLLLCAEPDAPAIVADQIVRCPDNSKFWPGQRIECMAVPSGGWQYCGPWPRRRGLQ